MFKSATLKLTGWYLAILMAISFIFSAAIYQLNTLEVSARLKNFQQGIINIDFLPTQIVTADQMRLAQAQQASDKTLLTLLNVNLAILIGGGIGSYILARRTLRPLEKAHDAQSRFTSDASHELRTPLAAMKAELEVALRDTNLDEQESRELLESNLEEVNKLINLSEFLLKLARLDYDKMERSPIDLDIALQSVIKHFPQAKKRIIVQRRRRPTIAFGNEPAVEEVMTILIDNALKYGPEDGLVTIRLKERGLLSGFSIHNEGPQIPPETLDKIFDRFYRVDTSRTNSTQNGYGLGLAIAKKIATIHHGDLTVKSNANGTTFHFMIPSRRKIKAADA